MLQQDRKLFPKRVLEPIERISEVLFGLIMVLTFTGSLSAAESGQAEVRTMLVGAIGCNLAWGFIDAIMYLMGCLAERGSELRTLAMLKTANSPDEARGVLAAILPSAVTRVLAPADLDRIHADLLRLPHPAERATLAWDDWLGAIAVFLLVFLSTLPIVLPFLILSDAWTALRTSNAIAVAMMAVTGYAFGRLAGYRPWVTAGSMVLLGCFLVALTIALGG
jgi:VIT1/CCC1 family predicted Fe2+/Mn2+ transporter